MKTFEYKVLNFDTSRDPNNISLNALNKLGAVGWEVCEVIADPSFDLFVNIFLKREIQPVAIIPVNST